MSNISLGPYNLGLPYPMKQQRCFNGFLTACHLTACQLENLLTSILDEIKKAFSNDAKSRDKSDEISISTSSKIRVRSFIIWQTISRPSYQKPVGTSLPFPRIIYSYGVRISRNECVCFRISNILSI